MRCEYLCRASGDKYFMGDGYNVRIITDWVICQLLLPCVQRRGRSVAGDDVSQNVMSNNLAPPSKRVPHELKSLLPRDLQRVNADGAVGRRCGKRAPGRREAWLDEVRELSSCDLSERVGGG